MHSRTRKKDTEKAHDENDQQLNGFRVWRTQTTVIEDCLVKKKIRINAVSYMAKCRQQRQSRNDSGRIGK